MTTRMLSIGMPVYNAARFIVPTIRSILTQTFTDLEVVVSDNASTDETPDLVRAMAADDDRIRYERNDTNVGIPRNFNRAYLLSRGTLFKWHAHDDLLAPTFVERCIEALDDDPATVLVAPRVRPIEDDGSAVPFDMAGRAHMTSYGEAIPPANDALDLASPRPADRFRSVLNLTDPAKARWLFGVARSAALQRSSLLGPFIGTESVLLSELSLQGPFREIPEELFFRTYHAGHAGWHADRRVDWVRMARKYAPHRRVILFPRARQLPRYARSVAVADLDLDEKLRCSGVLARKTVGVGRRRAAQAADGLGAQSRSASP